MGRGKRLDRHGRPATLAVSEISHAYTACEVHEVDDVYKIKGMAPRSWWQVTAVSGAPLEAKHYPTSREHATLWAQHWLLGQNGGTVEVFDLSGELLERLESEPWEKHPRYGQGSQLTLPSAGA